MTKYTPMIEQYLAIKAEVQDAFLFFRLGDFYELFFEDAIHAARELEITLTGRGGGTEERIPMCGVPYHSAEGYINRLIEKGYKVAICEQVEDPSQAKGVVRREIVRIVTPGTVMDGKLLGESQNNFIVAVASAEDGYGFVACDLTTGELYVTVIGSSIQQLIDELNVYHPAEMIADKQLVEQVKSDILAMIPSLAVSEWEKSDDSHTIRQFSAEDVTLLSPTSRRAVSLLLSYLSETQKRALSHITKIRAYDQSQFMIMDPFTRRNLELVETVRERTKKGSLLWLLDKTVTSMGGRLLRRWIDQPLMQKAKIEERQEAVHVLYHHLITREEIRQQLKEVYDLERLVARISYGNANARDLIALGISLAQVPALREMCNASGSATLSAIAAEMDDCADIKGWIDTAIVDDPPISIREGGIMKSGFHPHLDQLREASQNGKQWMAELEQQERDSTGIRSLKIGFNKVFGYYIEVTRSNLSSIPEGRYERKQTLANAERFITPELKEKESLILEAEEKMGSIEYELFMQLRDQIAAHIPRLQRLAEKLATVDVFQSFATVSAANRYEKPELIEGYELKIHEGRHPVVETVMNGGTFIANDTEMNTEDGRNLLITGPNMAGKSTYMRQVAIICIMAQIGCFVPAKDAAIPIIDRIFTRIGAADDLIGGQSTFMVEMMDIQVMTEKATARSLVIIDELGRGTSTGEGMAIAQAVIEYLYHQVGCKTLVSTHFHELAHLENSLPALRNHCMAVKESGQQVTFLRKLVKGAASTSYGIYCAQIAGLPQSIIERSYELLHLFDSRAEGLEQTAATSLDTRNAVQLSMFEIEQPDNSAKTKGKSDGHTDKIIEQLRNLDVLNMTPLQAMQCLNELKQKAQDKS